MFIIVVLIISGTVGYYLYLRYKTKEEIDKYNESAMLDQYKESKFAGGHH